MPPIGSKKPPSADQANRAPACLLDPRHDQADDGFRALRGDYPRRLDDGLHQHDIDCLGAIYPGEDAVYADAGWTDPEHRDLLPAGRERRTADRIRAPLSWRLFRSLPLDVYGNDICQGP